MSKILDDSLFFSMTWDYLEIYLPSQHRNSPQTIKSYRDALTVFRKYISEERKIKIEKFYFKDLTYEFLLDYRYYLQSKGLKERTVNQRLAAVTSYMRYAASMKVDLIQIYLNAKEVPYITVPSRIRETIDDAEAISMLLDAPNHSRLGIRDRVILTVLYDTAIRANELIQLNYADVNIKREEPYLRIHGKGDKERLVPLSDKTVPLVEQYLNLFHPNHEMTLPFIYTTIKGTTDRMTERNVERIVKKYGDIVRKDKPNMPERIYPHMLRRTRVTGWYQDGVPIETIAVILGHANTSTTRKSYAKPSVEMLRNEMNKGGTPTGTSDSVGATDPETSEKLWETDEDLAKLCGLR